MAEELCGHYTQHSDTASGVRADLLSKQGGEELGKAENRLNQCSWLVVILAELLKIGRTVRIRANPAKLGSTQTSSPYPLPLPSDLGIRRNTYSKTVCFPTAQVELPPSCCLKAKKRLLSPELEETMLMQLLLGPLAK